MNPDLLFLGSDDGLFVSLDRRARWARMNNNLPRISVHDLVIQARQKDLVLGTYGRGIWITNIAPLEELNAAVLAQDIHLFSISDTVQRVPWQFAANDYLSASRICRHPTHRTGWESGIT